MKALTLSLLQTVLVVALATGTVVSVIKVLGAPTFSLNQISTMKQSTFDVTGESKISTVPDQAEVRLGITINEPTVKGAQDKANQVINQINQNLGQMGVEKANIKTENYSLYPNYDYSPGSGQRITGYAVNASLVITMTDFAKLNQSIDMATQAGANQIGGITFTLSDDKRAEVEKEARQVAIDHAKDKANELSKLAGMRLGKIVNIIESPVNNSLIYPAMDKAMTLEGRGAGGGAPTNVEPGSTDFSYTVTLSYETL